ncbi:bile acid:sodium symporter family protein [candidate division KSB1 bacterium]|nr:bile acid:sodium symporter family protein [candidate division KSB1 bacterium]
MINSITRLFPFWAVLFSITAYFFPTVFASQKSLIIPLLALVMFGMGLTLTWQDFLQVVKQPAKIFLGVFIQFFVMPLAAFLLSALLQFPPDLMAGMVLVGSSAGGTASNVICYLARGNVALSISMTMVSTLLAIFFMPVLTWLYLHTVVAVPVESMFISVVKIVLVPVALGTALNSILREKLRQISPVFPFFSMVVIVFIIAIIVGLNQSRFVEVGLTVVLGVMAHNLIGMASGYGISKLFKYDEQTRRTIAIEVGMQNSGLSVALAVAHFSGLAALPGAIFSIWHNISGSLLAGWWSRKNEQNRSV